MVKDFYEQYGYELVNEDESGNKTYRLNIASYEPKTIFIDVDSQ